MSEKRMVVYLTVSEMQRQKGSFYPPLDGIRVKLSGQKRLEEVGPLQTHFLDPPLNGMPNAGRSVKIGDFPRISHYIS